VYGFRDPNPIVAANNTPLILQEQGIEVIHWPLAEIDAFYLSYNHWTQTKMPWVTAKIAQSLDGKIADANGPVALSNESCRQFTHTQRLYTDIIVTTAKTLIADNAALKVRLDGKEPIKKPVAIIDARLTTPLDAQIFTTATHCHIYYDASLQVMHTKPNVSYWPIPATAGRLHLEAVLKHLGEQGYHDVWVEAGGTLFTELHTRGLVQTTYIYVVPKVLGPTAPSAYLDAGMLNRPYTMSWHTKDDNIIGCMQALTTLA
jgi:diaminohydroxyphosphoribosylaminopyrimidine deaminase/5-amino-6-(5-phosphoribosylamino)uracil reductase